jgi:hypothetical protein
MRSKITKYPPGPNYKMPGKLIRQFIRDPIKTLSTISREYGDISYFKLGPKQYVYLINNPDYIERLHWRTLCMDGRYTYHRHYCTNVDNASGSRSANQTGSCNYIATQIWYENEADSKKMN